MNNDFWVEKSLKALSLLNSIFLWLIVIFIGFLMFNGAVRAPLFGEHTGLGRIERIESPFIYWVAIFLSALWLSRRSARSKFLLTLTALFFFLVALIELWFSATFFGILLAFGFISLSKAREADRCK